MDLHMKVPAMKLMKVPALPALCSDITDEMVESENAVICLPPALCSDITDRGSGGPHARRQSSRGRPRLPQHVATHPHPATLRGNLGTCLEHFFVTEEKKSNSVCDISMTLKSRPG